MLSIDILYKEIIKTFIPLQLSIGQMNEQYFLSFTIMSFTTFIHHVTSLKVKEIQF